jgi:ubiquinone/menaquinone biosynthesis C-methylase UbiE
MKVSIDMPTNPSDALDQVANLFDYRKKVAEAEDKLWVERYAPHLELYANLVKDRNARVTEIASGGKRLLDIGCGMGDLLVLLKDHYKDLQGIDPSRDMVEQARHNIEIRKLADIATITHGVAEALEFEDETFDTALMLDVFEHIRPHVRLAALAEVTRVLKPGGELILVTPSRRILRFWNLVDNLLLMPRRIFRRQSIEFWSFTQKNCPEEFLSKAELVESIRASRLEVAHFERVSFYPAPERPGYFGTWIQRAYHRPFIYRRVKSLFRLAGMIVPIRQKMLIRSVKT